MDFLLQIGWLGLPLLVTSIWAVEIIIERFFLLRKLWVRKETAVLDIDFLQRWEQSDQKEQLSLRFGARKDWLAQIVSHFFMESPQHPRSAELLAADLHFLLTARLGSLSTIARIAPLLGLLGTVVGLVNIFLDFSQATQQLDARTLLAGGIYQALLTTVAGLLIAIPVVAAHRFFSHAADEMEHMMNKVLTILSERYSREKGV